METDQDFYISWLEIQMANDELELEWRDNRRGIRDGRQRLGTEKEEVSSTTNANRNSQGGIGQYPDTEGDAASDS